MRKVAYFTFSDQVVIDLVVGLAPDEFQVIGKSNKISDETGAGDVYFSIFLYEFLCSDRTWNEIQKVGYYASAAASFLVEKQGPDGYETKEKIIERIKIKNYIK